MSRPLPAIVSVVLALVGCSQTTPEPAAAPAATKPLPSETVAKTLKPVPAAPAKTSAPTSSKDPAPVPAEGETKEAKVARIVEEATKIAQNGNGVEAVKRLDDALKLDPDNRQALFLSGRLTQRIAMDLERPQNNALFLKSARTLRKLRETYKDLNESEKIQLETALYNEACTHAINGKAEQALESLAEATAAGFGQIGLIDEDEELASIRKLPKFQELRAQVAERAREQAHELAKGLLAGNKPFAFDFSLPNLDGKPISLADFKGKVTVVDLWGTWCAPCRKEVPHLIELYKTYHDKGLEIVGLTYELVSAEDVKATIKAFIKENKIPYPCLIGDVKTQEQIPNFEGFPTSLYIDKAGNVRARLVGFVRASGQEFLMDELVKRLLSEEAGKPSSKP